MRWKQVCPKVRSLLKVEDPPHYLLVHCGGNDIGQEDKCVVLRENIKKGLEKLQNLLPNTTLIWSQVLPRLQWRGEVDHLALERARVRLNSCIATYILELGGKYIRYPELQESSPCLFRNKVHLNSLGNSFFLHRIQQSFQDFLADDRVVVTPKAGDHGPWLQYA